MKLGTVRHGDTTRAFRQEDGETRYLPVPDVGALLAEPDWRTLAGQPGEPPREADLLMPVLRPGQVIGVGLNYYDHAAEVGKAAPEVPTLFSKVTTALVGPGQDIELPSLSEQIDWEVELVIVIGQRVKNADEAAAREAIAGYTAMNDVSVRDWQRRTSEWFQGKNFDGSTPLGPVVTTADEIDPMAGLRIETLVNGAVEQSGTTADLIFSPVQLVVYLSQFLTLEPGDLIATGTPGGVGFVRTPPRFLADGDELRTRIEGIGELVNTVRIDR